MVHVKRCTRSGSRMQKFGNFIKGVSKTIVRAILCKSLLVCCPLNTVDVTPVSKARAFYFDLESVGILVLNA
jgi:hypothetical protein